MICHGTAGRQGGCTSALAGHDVSTLAEGPLSAVVLAQVATLGMLNLLTWPSYVLGTAQLAAVC
jgi:hypothetical protein